MQSRTALGFLINHDRLPAPLRENEIATDANGGAESMRFHEMRAMGSIGLAARIRFGRALWRVLHGVADRWPCRRCRPRMSDWMQGLHDAVNVRLGKPPFRSDSFARYESGSLEGPYHRLCFGCRLGRVASRWLARAPPPPNALH